MDDMTWMSSFYEPPFRPPQWRPALAVAAVAALLATVGGAALLARPQAPAGPGTTATSRQ